jgi:hypothetical protein
MTRAAVGFRSHSGWAAAVVVAGSVRALEVVDRRRIEFADPKLSGSVQPYHAAKELGLSAGEQFIARCTESSRVLARQALTEIIEAAQRHGQQISASGVLLAAGRSASSLEAILASHAMIHTAEGDLFRQVLVDASEQLRLVVLKVKERELFERAVQQLGMSDGELRDYLAELGRKLGPPWQIDQKNAALAGWLALAAPSSGRGT